MAGLPLRSTTSAAFNFVRLMAPEYVNSPEVSRQTNYLIDVALRLLCHHFILDSQRDLRATTCRSIDGDG